MESSKRQLFFSHSWARDRLQRNNHFRVLKLANLMKNFGFTIWIDEIDMKDDIDYSMLDGILKSEIFVCCLTESYLIKINQASSNPRRRENCYKEWSLACSSDKIIIPVIMEPNLKNIKNWPTSVVQLYLSNVLYIDNSNDESYQNALKLTKYLEKFNIYPDNLKYREALKYVNSKTITKYSVKNLNKYLINTLLSKPKNELAILGKPIKLKKGLTRKWGSTGQFNIAV